MNPDLDGHFRPSTNPLVLFARVISALLLLVLTGKTTFLANQVANFLVQTAPLGDDGSILWVNNEERSTKVVLHNRRSIVYGDQVRSPFYITRLFLADSSSPKTWYCKSLKSWPYVKHTNLDSSLSTNLIRSRVLMEIGMIWNLRPRMRGPES